MPNTACPGTSIRVQRYDGYLRLAASWVGRLRSAPCSSHFAYCIDTIGTERLVTNEGSWTTEYFAQPPQVGMGSVLEVRKSGVMRMVDIGQGWDGPDAGLHG